MIKKLIIILSFCILEFSLLSKNAFALTSTPSATPSVDIENKIKTLVKENLDTTETELKKNILSKSILGFTGKAKSVGTKNITLETEKDLLQIVLTEKTSITKNGSEMKSSSIALGDKLIVYGQKTKEEVLEAKLILVLADTDDTNLVETQTVVATFKTLDLKKKTFKLTINNEDIDFTLSKKNNVKLEDYKIGDTIFAITKKYLGKFSLSKANKI